MVDDFLELAFSEAVVFVSPERGEIGDGANLQDIVSVDFDIGESFLDTSEGDGFATQGEFRHGYYPLVMG